MVPPVFPSKPGADRDLVTAIRSELAAIEPTRACCRAAERAGLGAAARGRARTPAVARLAVRLGQEAQGRAFGWAGAAEHCRFAYLRGLFLAQGSLSLASSRVHLEFVVAPDEAAVLAGALADVGVPAAWRVRRGRGVVTWKSGGRVTRFLRAAGAGPSLLELEARGVSRVLRGELNRLFNAEAANLERAVEASVRQIAAIGRLEADGRLSAERPPVRAVAAARRRAPDATLSELAAETALTRSSVQRALERVERLAPREPGSGAAGAPSGVRPAPISQSGTRHSAHDASAPLPG